MSPHHLDWCGDRDCGDPSHGPTMDMQVWNGAVEILAAVKSVPFEHRLDAFAVAFDAFVRTSGTIDIDYPEDRLDALWCLVNPSDTRYHLDQWNERPGAAGSTVIDEKWSEQ